MTFLWVIYPLNISLYCCCIVGWLLKSSPAKMETYPTVKVFKRFYNMFKIDCILILDLWINQKHFKAVLYFYWLASSSCFPKRSFICFYYFTVSSFNSILYLYCNIVIHFIYFRGNLVCKALCELFQTAIQSLWPSWESKPVD